MTDHTPPIQAMRLPDYTFRDLPSRLRAHADAAPGAPGLIDGAHVLTLGDLAASMDQTAAALSADGVGPGDVVASLAGVTTDHVLLYLGTLALGAAMAPLPVSAHPDQLARMIENAAPARLYGDDRADSTTGAAPLAGLIAAAGDSAPIEPRAIAEGDLYDILYSSGTTGAPKGIEHDCLFRDVQLLRMANYGIGPGTVTLVSTPIYSNTTLATLLPALGLGGATVLMRKFDEAGFLALAERHRVTHAMLVPVQIRRLLDHPEFDRFDLSSFQAKLATSAPLTAPVLREVLDRWPGRMINIYGMTEGGVSAVLDAGAHPDRLHTMGRVPPGAELRVIDADGSELPPGETGEIVGRSATMMRRYRNAPETTQAATWTSPEGDVFIRSGDMGMLDTDGFLTLKDRAKDMIISGGFNIFASDLEAVLYAHDAVKEAAVIGIDDARWGETPVACVVLQAGATTTVTDLIEWTNAQLGRTQRLTGLAILDSLPRSSIGKVLKRDLRDAWQLGKIDRHAPV